MDIFFSFFVDIMASSSSEKMAPKSVMFKFQGVPSKSRFDDDYVEIKDIDVGHIDLGEFLRICNKPTERSAMIFALIRSRLVNIASYLMSMQSSKLVMTLAQHFVPEERVVKSVTGEIVLNL